VGESAGGHLVADAAGEGTRVAVVVPFLAPVDLKCEQSPRKQKALREAGVECDLITVPDGTHGTREWEERLPGWADQVVAWLAGRIER
jgi:acetyl esterase/lipase